VGFFAPTVTSAFFYIKRHWPVLLALGVFAVTTIILWNLCQDKNGGQFVYTLDDPYIHMAIAKNVVRHGVWGVTPYQFSSSSSSPLWTLGLTLAYGLFGVRDLTAFIFNLIFAGLALGLVYVLLRGRLPGWAVSLALVAVIFFPPLVPMVFSGMEHTAHLFFTLLTVALAAKTLSQESPSPMLQGGLLISTFLTTAVRYEGLFLILILSILFACRKRWLFTLFFVGAGVVPLAFYGVWSAAQGWYFLPNPVILKGSERNWAILNFLDGVFMHGQPLTWRVIERLAPVLFLNRIFAHAHILFLLVPSLILLVYRRGSFWKPANTTNTAFIGSVLLHMQFAGTGWFYRYEAYLVAFGIYALAVGLADHLPGREAWQGWGIGLLRAAVVLLLAILISYPLRVRAAKSLKDTPKASHNIFEQQYQMAFFLRQFYQGQVVAANDIGAINYLADFRLVDLAGLGTRESAAFKLKQSYGSRQVAAVAEQYDVQIALVYDSWFQIPGEWIKVGEWQIRDNVVCGDDTVSFYAVDPRAVADLIGNLRAFTYSLPGEVIQRGDYR